LRNRNEALIEVILIVLGTDHFVEWHFLLTLVAPVTLTRIPWHRECTGVLNVNRATEAELRLLPGIGKRRAQLIVERRDKRPFTSVEEIGRIKGMRALVQRLRARLAVQGDTTLRPLRLDRNP